MKILLIAAILATSALAQGPLPTGGGGGGGGGSTAFNAITSGTNATAAMVVGTGASLAPSGTGTIAATSVIGGTVGGCAFGGTASGAATLTTQTCYFRAMRSCTVTAADMTVNAGTITFDVWVIAPGTAIPTITNTITASALPAIASGTALHDVTLTGWTTTIAIGSWIGININTAATATYASLQLGCA